MNDQPKFREGFVDIEESKPSEPIAKVAPVEQDEPVDIDIWPLKVRLMKPIHVSGSGDILHELTFREPTGRDINRHGNPTRMGPDLMFIIDEKKMMLMMTALSGVMTPDLERMDARDWNTCAWRLYRFFLPSTILD